MRHLVLAVVLVALPALAQEPAQEPSQEPYVELVKRVQIALHLEGFDPGPINGVNEGRSQAALAQFQLSRNLPASGALDDATLQALGVTGMESGEENASAGSGMPLARP